MRLFDVRPRILQHLLPLDMFHRSIDRSHEEAARARRLEGLYHVSQKKV